MNCDSFEVIEERTKVFFGENLDLVEVRKKTSLLDSYGAIYTYGDGSTQKYWKCLCNESCFKDQREIKLQISSTRTCARHLRVHHGLQFVKNEKTNGPEAIRNERDLELSLGHNCQVSNFGSFRM